MFLSDTRFSQAVEALVTELEKDTDTEIVVVASRRSGGWRDLEMAVGGVLGAFTILFVLYSPLSIWPNLVPLLVLAMVGLGVWFAHHSDALLYRMASPGRRQRQVYEAASIAFVEEAVHGTRRRNGLLVYASEMEREIHIIPDLGLQGKVPDSAWNKVPRAVTDLDSLLAILQAIGKILATHAPPIPGDNPDEIPNPPRIRK